LFIFLAGFSNNWS